MMDKQAWAGIWLLFFVIIVAILVIGAAWRLGVFVAEVIR